MRGPGLRGRWAARAGLFGLAMLVLCLPAREAAGETRGDCLAGAHGPAPASGLLAGIPPARLTTLSRGVNLTTLFGPAGLADPEGTFRQLRQTGVRHVRVPVSPDIFASPPPVWQADALARLDRAVCAAIASNLGIIIDLHPFGPLLPANGSAEAIAAGLAHTWRELAGRYGDASPDLVFFELFNEPKIPDVETWSALQTALAGAVRSRAPRNTLIATASPWSTAFALSGLTPLADRNVAYAFHFYTPMIFTHQAAEWAVPSYASVRNLVFPAESANVSAVERETAPARRKELASYGADFADGRRIAAELDTAADWAERHQVALLVTEFGVYGRAAPRLSRAAWLMDVRHQLEARGIGWTVWEYDGGFGIADDLRKPCEAPGSAARALALCSP